MLNIKGKLERRTVRHILLEYLGIGESKLNLKNHDKSTKRQKDNKTGAY